MKRTDNHTFFFSAKDVFSNWHPCVFEHKGVVFNCNEQFMMYCKAKLFNDEKTAAAILASSSPKEQKALGRAVHGLKGGKWDAEDKALWDSKARKFVAIGAKEKFLQNPSMYDVLMSTGETVLVEASPYDTIWGIGLGMDDPRAMDPSQWRGRNELGQVLTALRAHFVANPHLKPSRGTPCPR